MTPNHTVERIMVAECAVIAIGWYAGAESPEVVIDGVAVDTQTCRRIARPDVAAVHGPAFRMSGFRIVAMIDPETVTDNARIRVRFRDEVPVGRTLADHAETTEILAEFQGHVAAAQAPRMIEIGSRARSCNSYRNLFPDTVDHTGVDITDGPNVDVVADAHKLSRVITDRYDFAFSISVFEHLIMPWTAAYELNRVLKPGALAYVQSHPTWPMHEVPWDFFRFSKYSWQGLFNRLTGFEILRAGHAMEAVIVALDAKGGALQGIDRQMTYLLSACMIRKISEPLVDWSADPEKIADLRYSH